MSKKIIPLWHVFAEKHVDKNKKSSEYSPLRMYDVIATEFDERGRSNEYNVKSICNEKGYTIMGVIFVGYTNHVPYGAIDISDIQTEDEKSKKKLNTYQKTQFKRGKQN